MLSKFVRAKSLALSLFSMVGITPLVLASSPGYTQTPSPAESPATLTPVSPADVPTAARSAPSICPSSSVIASVVSEPMPLPGQTSRSSLNFDLSRIQVGERFRVVVVVGRTPNTRIRFNVKKDIRFGIDPIVGRDMHTGVYQKTSTSNDPLYPVYIADPKGAGTNRFAVQFCRL